MSDISKLTPEWWRDNASRDDGSNCTAGSESTAAGSDIPNCPKCGGGSQQTPDPECPDCDTVWKLRAQLDEPKTMTLSERIENYHRVTGFPLSLFIGGDGRMVGTWIMGNDYRVKSTYYGGYPAGYLKRVKALFPEKKNVLHLFSGKVDTSVFPGATVDINSDTNPDYIDDAQSLLLVPLNQFDLVLADPPYSIEDCDHYQTTMIKRNKVMAALSRLPAGCHVVWLDQVLPMYRKDQFCIDAAIGMMKSTNHRFRMITIFRRL